jgi:hypothetical protein
MTEIIRLQPHDPLPEARPYALVIRRFGEDDPNATITEIDFFGAHPTMSLAAGENGRPARWDDVVHYAQKQANARGYATLYAVDRTAGAREQEILAHHGDHAVRSEELSDTDAEDGVSGTSLRDRGRNAGFFR